MQKTTVYLPDHLKAGVEREARRRSTSEAEVIRDAIALRRVQAAGGGAPGLLSDVEPFRLSALIIELLDGFGER